MNVLSLAGGMTPDSTAPVGCDTAPHDAGVDADDGASLKEIAGTPGLEHPPRVWKIFSKYANPLTCRKRCFKAGSSENICIRPPRMSMRSPVAEGYENGRAEKKRFEREGSERRTHGT